MSPYPESVGNLSTSREREESERVMKAGTWIALIMMGVYVAVLTFLICGR